MQPIKETIDNNNRILDNILDSFKIDAYGIHKLNLDVRTHVSLISQISTSVNEKYFEIMTNTRKYIYREKRGIFNGIGTLWKSITGNLDASDGEYFNDCINKISRDEYEIENL